MLGYPDYKKSDIQWFPKLPAHWEYGSMKYLLERNDGGVWGDDSDSTKGTIVLRSTEITLEGKWDLSNPAIRLLSYGEIEKALLFEGDLLITKSSGSEAHIGKTALVNDHIARLRACYSNFMQRIRPKPNVESRFIHYFMNSNIAREQYNYQSTTTTGLANLNSEIIGHLKLPFPPLNEQRIIADFLDHKTSQIDSLIKEKQHQIELLEEYRTALINQAVTKGLDPDVPMKDSGIEWLGEIPKHWEILKVSWLFRTIGSGTTPKSNIAKYYDSGTINWVITGDLNNGLLKDTEKKVTNVALFEYSTLKLYPRNTLIIAMYGATIGKLSITDFEGCTNQACCALADSSKIKIKYAFYWFLVNRTNIVSLALGGGQPNISQEIIRSLKISTPPISEQERIIDLLDEKTGRIDNLINRYNEEIKLLLEYRTSLISNTVTGKIDVRSWNGAEDGIQANCS